MTSVTLQNRLGAERIVTLDEGIVSSLSEMAGEKKLRFGDLLVVTTILALTDGSSLPALADLAARCRLSVKETQLCVDLLRQEKWLTGEESPGGERVWVLKRKEASALAISNLKETLLPTQGDEIFAAWATATGRPVSVAQRSAVLKELTESPRHSELASAFFHALRPTAGIMELAKQLTTEADSLIEAALRWEKKGRPELKELSDRARACHGLWLSIQTSGRYPGDYYRVLSAVILGLTPQVFRDFCRSKISLNEALDGALQRQQLPLADLLQPVDLDDRTTLERFLETPLS